MRLGWRYNTGQAGDLSVTGWYIMALKSAKIAGLHVDPNAFDGAMKFLDSVEIKDPNGGPSRYAYQPGTEHPESAHLLTRHWYAPRVNSAAGRKKRPKTASNGLSTRARRSPKWSANGKSVDLYYWYYGSLSTFQQGGDPWKRFNHGLIQALTKNQCKTGDDAGSWPIVGEFSDEWGRVGQTAMAALCLETYYRYERLKGTDFTGPEAHRHRPSEAASSN